MVVTTNAIVFSSLKYGEADLIVSCYTESSGLKIYLLRGILKSRKGKLRASYFQPLTLLELTAVHKDKGTLERISEARISEPYQSLHTDVVKSAIVMFLAEMLKTSIQEEEPNSNLFAYIKESLLWLDRHENVSNFHILFLLNLTHYIGFYPDTEQITSPYFNLQEGNFENTPFGKSCETGTHVEGLKLFFGMNFEALDGIKLTKTNRSEVLNLLLKYYQLHLQAFRKPKSLLVLNQLFN